MRPTEGAGPASRATVAARLLVVPRVGSFENAARSFAGGTPHPRLDTDRETDSEQVPRGKVEKHSEKRVKENAKPSEARQSKRAGESAFVPGWSRRSPRASRCTPVEESRDGPDPDRSRGGLEAALAPPTRSASGAAAVAPELRARAEETGRALRRSPGSATLSTWPRRPVLKHGPRSLTRARADGSPKRDTKAEMHSEGERKHGRNGRSRGARCRRIESEGAPALLRPQRTRQDPKDGELRLGRPKPDESPVEGRSGSDVQIDRATCA